ncbi:hypothetical protein [Rhodoferax saidenbachensis]|uniref:Uncharacterized protein n=1 Tax=Rhodoferax saidenbachensis TaxID=1484693 RepID=A0A1P8K5G4_9BURK|nr:hypothetical protein [Rhodoferax saidenbachensis]APW41260.1 hypothetical protein RS694_01000 [Rhodoferax saidenbachensis]
MARFISSPLVASASAGSSTGARTARRDLDGSRTLAGMLLAAVLAALLVVADQVIDTWADGHLLVGWVALWTVAFAALAILAPPLRQLASSMAAVVARWSHAARQRRMEETMWEHAKQDPRIMAELQAAMTRERS